MDSYNRGFEAMFEEMQEASGVTVKKKFHKVKELPEVIVEEQIGHIRQESGFELCEDLKECISASNGTRLWWLYEIDEGRSGGGEFHLRHLVEVFTYGPPELWSEETPPEEVEFLKKLHVIDQRPNAGDNKFAAFKLEQGRMPPEIWYYDRGDCFKMDIDYPGYLGALMDTKGITDWQYLFCDVDLTETLQAGLDEKLENRMRDLETLFPQRDYSAYYERIDRMKA